METTLWTLAIFTYLWNYVESAPPEACRANFRWDDCGLPPKAVLYYYKSGSRCEVGFWRGCLPNPNMFKDEYECVTTCIFSVRGRAADYHNLNEDFEIIASSDEMKMPDDDVEDTTNATDVYETTTLGDEGSGDGGSGDEGSGDEGSGVEDSDDSATDSTNAGEDATEAATAAADGEEAEAEEGKADEDGEKAPADGEKAPADGEAAPADGEKAPAEGGAEGGGDGAKDGGEAEKEGGNKKKR